MFVVPQTRTFSNMDYILRIARPATSFTMVPNALIRDHRLSAKARMALIVLCSMPNGTIVRISEVQRILAVGVAAWRKIATELRQRGALVRSQGRDRATGRLTGSTMDVTWEPWLLMPDPDQPQVSKINPDPSPRVGFSDCRENRLSNVRKTDSAESGFRTPIKRERKKRAKSDRQETEAYREWSRCNRGAPFAEWMASDARRRAIETEQCRERQGAGRKPDAP